MDIIDKASSYAQSAHLTQLDDEGNPYIMHCAKVVELVSRVTTDKEIIAAAWLHDTLEDTDTTYDQLKEEFGERIANLVHEVTHDGSKENGYYFPRLKSKDAILIKFADRLHNLSRMDSWDEKRRAHYIKKSRFWRSRPPEESD